MRNIFLLVTLLSYSATAFSFNQADTVLIKEHLTAITKTKGFRNHQNIALLDQTAAYIQSIFKQYADSVIIQEYFIDGKSYKNVIGSFGVAHKKRIIVGAHYDVCGDQEGADDNASGIVGLLETARLLKGQKLNHRIDLVAYTLEEPPYFRTTYMGSYVHAKSLKDNNIDVYGMLSIEMIGYFKDAKKSQSYPLKPLSLLYGTKGDYITLVKKFGSGKFANRFGKAFKRAKSIRTKTFKGPKALPGIDFSDHLNYWHFDFSTLMITDTSFYRNSNYHQKTDTMETLDLNRMAKVIDGIVEGVIKL